MEQQHLSDIIALRCLHRTQ